jgi:hypothetical protein
MGRTLFIGDVHGCSVELEELLELLAWRDDDRVVFVGDLIGRGPDSKGVLRQAERIGATTILGNHEQRLLSVRKARAEGERGPRLGPDHEALYESLDDREWAFLERELPSLDLPEHGVRVVHAGVVQGLPIEDHSVDTLTRMRSVDAAGKPSSKYRPIPWAATYRGPPHVVFGHNARMGLQLYEYATGLDTGCVYGKSLAAMALEAGQTPPRDVTERRACITSVPAHAEYFDYRKA